jgi:TonB family protein
MKIKLHSYKLLFRLLDFLSNSKWLHKLVVDQKVYLGASIISLSMVNSACTSDKENTKNEHNTNYSNKKKGLNTQKNDSNNSLSTQDSIHKSTNHRIKPLITTSLCYVIIGDYPIEKKLDSTELYPYSLVSSCYINFSESIYDKSEIEITTCYDMPNEEWNNVIKDTITDIPENIISADGVYISAEKMPEFKGGNDSLQKFITTNLKYPKNAIQKGESGVVYVKFIVEKDGKVTNISVVKKLSPKQDAEALRLVKKMPAWKPGSIDDEPVRVWVFLPIKFNIQ